MARYHGKAGRVYMSGSAGEAVVMVAMAEWSLDMSKDRVDATALEDGNIVEFPGFAKIGGKVSGFWDNTYDTLWLAVDSSTASKMYVYPSKDAPTKYWEGLAWIDASISGSVKDMVKVDVNFSAGGTWVRH